MSKPLTIKQEAFCQAYLRLGDKSAAYREAYSCLKMKPETIHAMASKLSSDQKVAIRIEQLQKEAPLTKMSTPMKKIFSHKGL